MGRRAVFLCLFLMLGGIALSLFGCYPAVVRVDPPAPRIEVYGSPPYPEAVWRPGHWAHRGGEWTWVPGHWARRPRPGAVWVPGHWERGRGGWVWYDGRWDYR